MKHVTHVLIIALMLAATGLVATPQLASAQDTSRGEVRPDVGEPGTIFRFFATGFQSVDPATGGDDEEGREEVSIWVNAPDGAATTDGIGRVNQLTDQGRIDWQWVAPPDAQLGTWSAVAFGNDSGNEVVIRFEVRADAPPVPEDPERLDQGVAPQSGSGGTEFAFYATGFDETEELAVWVNTPSGEAFSAETDELNQTTPSGRADWFWTAPEDAEEGTWSMVAHGKQSGVERVIVFDILP
jgi:hypothetical protein